MSCRGSTHHSWLIQRCPLAHPPGLLLILLWSEGLLASWPLTATELHLRTWDQPTPLLLISCILGRPSVGAYPSPLSLVLPLPDHPCAAPHLPCQGPGHSWLRLSLSLFTCLKCGLFLADTFFFFKIYHYSPKWTSRMTVGAWTAQPALCSPFSVMCGSTKVSGMHWAATEDPIKVDWTKSSRTDLGLFDSLRVFYLFTLLLCPQWLMVSFLRHHM